MHKSRVWSKYNRLRAATRHGAVNTDAGRVNRGLGLAQSRLGPAKSYASTPFECSCPDRLSRGVMCKHMICEYLRDDDLDFDQGLYDVSPVWREAELNV